MTTASSTGHIAQAHCADHDAAIARMGPRDVDVQSFRHACVDLLNRLDAIGPGDGEAEQRRQRLMRTVYGVLVETDCGQPMIVPF